MYLSNLDIVGFKSFADKTKLLFNEGITAIVGPNGCGKTNVVDSIRWVLGEQKSSTLRSDKMEDVIFNGTRKRKPLGMAEVSMTIQNSRGVLPTEYSEVTLTRRLFRNGDSQYLLNKTVCRLRDILDLFMDTGMGCNAYSVIELKMIETILSDKTDERRRLFEEAAGITKYKTRRREALRRMDAIETDLSRVRDILTEVEKNVRSLARQASKAKRHKEITDQLKALEILLLQHEFFNLRRQLEPLEKQREEQVIQRNTVQRDLVQQEEVVAKLEEQQSDVEERLSGAEEELATANKSMSDATRELAVSKERMISIQTARGRSEQDKAELISHIAKVSDGLAEAEQTREKLEEELGEAQREFDTRKSHQDESMAHVQEVRTRARDVKSGVMNSMDEINNVRATTERNRARIESLQRRIEETRQTGESSSARRDELRGQLDEQAPHKARHDQAVEDAEKKLADVQEFQVKLREETEDIQRNMSERQRDLSHKRASLEFLGGLVDMSESSEFLLGNTNWLSTSKPLILAEAIGADEELRVALAAALGPAGDYFVVASPREARSGIQQLRDSDKGKASFVCLENVPESAVPPAAPAGEGILGWASEIVRVEDERLRHALRLLLNGTLLVRSAADADAAALENGVVRAVTLEGDIVGAHAAFLGGGSSKNTEGAMIGRREKMALLEKDIAALESEMDQLQRRRNEKRAEYNNINLREYSDAIRRAEAERSRYDQLVGKLRYDLERTEQSLARTEESIASFQAEIEKLSEKGGDNLPELSGLIEKKESLEKDLAATEEELRQAEEKFEVDSGESHRAEMKLVQLRGEAKSLDQELDRLNSQLAGAKRRLEFRTKEIESSATEYEHLSGELGRMETAVQEAQNVLERARERRNAVAAEQSELRKTIHKQAETLRTQRREHDGSVNTIHKLELDLERLRGDAARCKTRAQEEFELELTGEEPPADHPEGDRPFRVESARGEIADLKRRLSGMGAVNLLAFDEFEKESERKKFLDEQLSDLLESQKTLSTTIAEINATVKQKFSETFAQIRENFVRIFRTLFEAGDEADLLLEEGDPLEAKVEIIAKPRGKRPASIDMLSGGEKTLTAIALLFAIYLVKPSPFCILDEVDAPLDDANIDRYLRLIREFSKETQFIMITHNKRTMEAADTMYGVSMQDSVSRLVSIEPRKHGRPIEHAGHGRPAAVEA